MAVSTLDWTATKRKAVLVRAEGQSEINALKSAVSVIFDSKNPEIEVYFPTTV